ncbi:YicC/YloC family endoribonuclease [Paenibacillus sediminis]|uniref:Uncharacterized protein (TIGR00255 family) n=1 Tax=Paenibacillus sediminis TaxID=664909 RepID=A0ABS4GZ83_9BACL|nr:YicC/YloC family endoribonuclease [Paenibacillus sediminis]MBP1935565.1 uncharacterized protein (TIGR00255 family) [Paenibacillus sediminis]
MSFSMTGYGQSAVVFGGYKIQFEIKSVNHRYSEVVFRMPREWTCYEDALRRVVQSHVKRGRIDVFINKEIDADNRLSAVLNVPVVEAYLHAAQELKEKFGLDDTITAKDILSLPDVLVTPEISSSSLNEDQGFDRVLQEGLEQALQGLLNMRRNEGSHLAQDIEKRLRKLESHHNDLKRLAPVVVSDYREKLRRRLTELQDESFGFDEYKFGMEIAVFADRSNIDEELTRLHSHFEQCRGLLGADEPVGRKLDFLIQEMNREVNTIGSKANHLALVNSVVEMKAELEKIREQAANIE